MYLVNLVWVMVRVRSNPTPTFDPYPFTLTTTLTLTLSVTRSNAAVLKNMITNFMRAMAIPLPHNDRSFDVLDVLFFVLLPVALVFNHKDDEDNFLEKVLEQEYAGHWEEKSVTNRETERYCYYIFRLNCLCEKI